MDKSDIITPDGIARRDVLKLAGAAVVGIGGVALTGGPALAAGTGGGGGVVVSFFELSADRIETFGFKTLVELRMAVERPEHPAFVAVIQMANRPKSDVYAWFTAALAGKKAAKRSAQITAFDQEARPVLKWNLTGAAPSAIVTSSGPSELITQLTFSAEMIAPG